jgi:ankyrin repeat protein
MKILRTSLVAVLAVTLVVSAQTDKSRKNADEISGLFSAILFGDSQSVERLLKSGADPNEIGPMGTTPLMWAVPDLDKIRTLLAHGSNVNSKSETDRTALVVASSYPGTVSLLKLLLDHGADLHTQDKAGATALSLAVRSADIDVLRFLVEQGLDPNSLTVGARRVAFARHDLSTTEYLMSKSLIGIPDVLITAAAWQPTALIVRWLDAGADVNASNPAFYARTALLTAVTSEDGSPETVKLLLERGANPNARTTEGESPLDWAIYKSDRAKIDILQQYHATRGNGPRQEEIAPPQKDSTNRDPRVSIRRSVSRLFDASPGFREKTNCISCHHNTMPALAAAAARKKGIEINETRARKNIDDLYTFFKANVPRMMMGDPAVGGEALTAGYAQMALAADGHPLDVVTAAITNWLLARQMPDGSWLGNGINRPPSEYSTISHTAIAVGGLKSYAIPGRQKEISRSIERARRWLLSANPHSSEERAMRLMGLAWSDAPKDRVAAAIKEIREHQEASGGWSQFGRTPPDAYATGMSLYTLHVAGVAATDAAYRKGIDFLLETQYPDGAWLVKTHSFPQQRYFESGFPFGHHQWISSAGTSWATLAIAETLK